MSGFSTNQLRALTGKLDRKHVRSRKVDDKQIDYIEGWFAVAEANAIFGYAGWDRETVHFERTFERTRGDTISCGYIARVRIRVRAGRNLVIREGSGFGTASARSASDAHERALKAAETDATKRALATFGNRFGLCLYDKDQNGVSEKRAQDLINLLVRDCTGAIVAERLSPESFCAALRQVIAHTQLTNMMALEEKNQPAIELLKTVAPDLKTPKGEHYADVLKRLIAAQQSKADALQNIPQVVDSKEPLSPSRIAPGPRIDKSVLEIGTVRRLRDKAHLRSLNAEPCLVCGRLPTHAHHVTFAQPRGLSLKVSDEYTVPLCPVHHDELHRSGLERDWWHRQGIDPLPIALGLWDKSHSARIQLSESNAAIGMTSHASHPS